jgi:hypothetical protein
MGDIRHKWPTPQIDFRLNRQRTKDSDQPSTTYSWSHPSSHMAEVDVGSPDPGNCTTPVALWDQFGKQDNAAMVTYWVDINLERVPNDDRVLENRTKKKICTKFQRKEPRELLNEVVRKRTGNGKIEFVPPTYKKIEYNVQGAKT